MDLATAAWPDLVAAPRDLVLVPVGSCEQHGPHLPFVTDAAIAQEVARRTTVRLCADEVRAVLAPALAFGASGEHQHFPGTLSIGHDALGRVLVELGRSASTWARRIVFVNGHGGNVPAVRDAVRRLRYEGRDASWVACDPPGADAHAGLVETSLMSAIAPAVVRSDAAQPGATEPIDQLMPRLREHGVIGVSANGVLGDPAGASADHGRELLDRLVETTVRRIRDGRPDPSGRLLEPAGVRS